MNRLIQSRKKQLNQLKHILRLQDLLTEYDRQNAFLNLQVRELLKQNQILQNSVTKSNTPNKNLTQYNTKSKQMNQNHSKFYNTNNEINSFSTQRKQKNNLKQKNSERKRYNYHFDDLEIQNSLKNKINTKEIIKNSKQKEQQTKISQFKPETQMKQQTNSSPNSLKVQNKQMSRSHSRSKSRSGSKKKIQVTSNPKSNIYQTQVKNQKISKDKPIEFQSRLIQERQIKQNIFTSQHLSKSNRRDLPQTQEKSVNRSPYLQQDDIFLHSFGQNQSKVKFREPVHFQVRNQQKKLQKPIVSQLKNQRQNLQKPIVFQIKNQQEKQQKNVFHIQNMLQSSVQRVQTFKSQIPQQKLLKTQTKLETQRSSLFKSSQKRKNHSLNPSPKISLTTSKKFVAVQPFSTEPQIKQQKIIQRIKTIQSNELEFPKNKQKKRRFITVTSASKDKKKN